MHLKKSDFLDWDDIEELRAGDDGKWYYNGEEKTCPDEGDLALVEDST